MVLAEREAERQASGEAAPMEPSLAELVRSSSPARGGGGTPVPAAPPGSALALLALCSETVVGFVGSVGKGTGYPRWNREAREMQRAIEAASSAAGGGRRSGDAGFGEPLARAVAELEACLAEDAAAWVKARLLCSKPSVTCAPLWSAPSCRRDVFAGPVLPHLSCDQHPLQPPPPPPPLLRS